ncbi:MAG: nicotinate-nucleotide adenylyltransferase [Gemmatimonadota bacterium]
MIGLFGGSFDPVHHGHLIAAQVAAETLELSEVRFVVAGEQPFKRGRHGATALARVEMVARAIAGSPGLAVERCEVEREGPSYTVETLRLLREREPGREFVLLVGADAAREMPTWREGAVIPQLARVAAFARPGEPRPEGLSHVWRIVDVPLVQISATAIRERVAAGRPIRYWVPDAVAEYIAANRLYFTGL